MTIEIETGKERHVSSSSIVSINGKLPLYQELRTSILLNVLITFSSKSSTKNLRKKINQWLYSRTRPGFYMELDNHLHLAYADQRDGHGTQHWWRLFFDEQFQEKIETATKSSSLTVGNKASESDRSSTGYNAYREWGGMYFRSQAEIAIAEELDKRNVLFFGNVRGRVNEQDLPAAKASQSLSGRVELDFLVFKDRRCMILEVDGQHHQEGTNTIRDYVRDRVLLREGISTARFTAQECLNQTSDVVTEFLELF
ncbi:MAG: DUF559 domain-containing protein [Xenococcus sp. MO_188.B8]|nr:DUF559 domain-containing protein [Xenococcus sp. MO_188.B8]